MTADRNERDPANAEEATAALRRPATMEELDQRTVPAWFLSFSAAMVPFCTDEHILLWTPARRDDEGHREGGPVARGSLRPIRSAVPHARDGEECLRHGAELAGDRPEREAGGSGGFPVWRGQSAVVQPDTGAEGSQEDDAAAAAAAAEIELFIAIRSCKEMNESATKAREMVHSERTGRAMNKNIVKRSIHSTSDEMFRQMTANNVNGTTTKEMVYSELQELLRENGTLNKLQTLVRAEILQSVLRDGCDGEAVPSPGTDNHAIVSLAYHELARLGLAHSTNILLSEFRLRPLQFGEALSVLGFNGGKSDGAWQPLDLPELIRTSARWPNELEQDTKSVQVDDIEARSIEERIRAVQHECELRMKQELRERLLISAKKQAMEASRRVEARHAQQLRELRHQLESERHSAKKRMEDLQSETELRCLSAAKQTSELEQRLIAVGLEKQAIQGEVDLMNDRLKRLQAERFAELTDVRNEMIKEHNSKLAELEDEKRAMHQSASALSLERESIRVTKAKFASIEAEKGTLIGELSKMRERESASFSLRTELLRLNHDLAERNNHVHSLEKQIVQMTDSLAKSQSRLESSRNEVAGLRNLLKQSKDCLSGLSFRGSSAVTLQDFRSSRPRSDGLVGPSINPAPPNYVRPRQDTVVDVVHDVTTGVSSFSAAGSKRPSKRPTSDTSARSIRPCESHTPSARPPLHYQTEEACQTSFESDGVDVSKRNTPEDPPCGNLVDPPAPETRCHEDEVLRYGAPESCDNSLVGRDVFLNLSAIKEESQAEIPPQIKKEGSSFTSRARMSDALPSIDSCRKHTRNAVDQDSMPLQAEDDDAVVQQTTGNANPNVDAKEATALPSQSARDVESSSESSSNGDEKQQPDSLCGSGASNASERKISTLTLDKHSSQRTSLDKVSGSEKARQIPDTGRNEAKTATSDSDLPAPDTASDTMNEATSDSQYSDDFTAIQSRTAAENTTMEKNDEIVSFSSQQARIIGGLEEKSLEESSGSSSCDDYSNIQFQVARGDCPDKSTKFATATTRRLPELCGPKGTCGTGQEVMGLFIYDYTLGKGRILSGRAGWDNFLLNRYRMKRPPPRGLEQRGISDRFGLSADAQRRP
ncbi:hypothetical protein THAOC_20640 [Thalassiosira oceanica]|uniref:LisH domain-containing protein n=1 Tax=Thalassiosira oceanica TaxID=159749 RepID=K0RZG7_THAOC|nr:hypothetical protein THAOC_20640 [Thalassiosira oceanica]|eukprot:EJK59173.1 hypothetical protein THAOC_20640 [Thalassiosira oceanica]